MNNTFIRAWIFKLKSSLTLLCVWLICLIIINTKLALAGYEDPTGQTNVNKIDPLFEEKIENFSEFKKALESQKSSAIGSIQSKEGLSFLPGSETKAKAEAERLSKIEAIELESRGREEFNKHPELNDIFVDYSKPGMLHHKEDAEKIAEGTDKLLGDLLGKLKELGIDCKSIKGSKVIEPEYYIEIGKTSTREPKPDGSPSVRENQDTVYDQHFCEQLRNRYNCNDALSLKCKVHGMDWGPWQDKQIRVPGGEMILGVKSHIFFVDRVVPGCFEYKLIAGPFRKFGGMGPLRNPDPHVVQGVREFLAAKHNTTIDSIDTQMSSSWEGGIFSISGWTYLGRRLGSKDNAWHVYIINYRYREGKPICAQWDEEWTEQCRLN